mmetsp:Transcript_35844/g.69279  ORF Transcript_35844/g.69279 Transcript_35844/m.69279 type:complete len:111 (+) Transcript_35844:253-585(+)
MGIAVATLSAKRTQSKGPYGLQRLLKLRKIIINNINNNNRVILQRKPAYPRCTAHPMHDTVQTLLKKPVVPRNPEAKGINREEWEGYPEGEGYLGGEELRWYPGVGVEVE